MWIKLLQVLVGFFCGYIFILSFPVKTPFNVSEFIYGFVLNPFEFFTTSVIFIIGFMVNATIIRDGVEQIALLINQKQRNILEFICSLLLILSFFILFYIGFWQTVIFFCFSVLYGIISLDFKRLKIIVE